MFVYVTSFLILFDSIFAYKILVFSPRLGHSHVNFMGKIADILVEAGHNVTVLIPDLNPAVSNNGSKLATIVRKKLSVDHYFDKNSARNMWKNQGDSFPQVYKLYRRLTDSQRMICQMQLEDDKLMDRLQVEQYDLGITEQISFCGYAIFKRINLTNHITATATNLMEVVTDAFGVSSNPSYVPAYFSSKMDKMNYIDRLTNVIMYMITYCLTKFVSEPAAQSLQHYLPSKFNFIDAVRESSLFLVNSDELLDFPRLINRKVVFVGGIGIPEVTALTQDYRNIMEQSEDGVVLVSFGSLVKSEGMSVEKRKIFEDAFRQLPEITFLWKFENDGEGEEKGIVNPSNIVKRKWLPQNDLLHHRKLLTFISHCGLNSLIESVNAGVPLICIPLFADQFRNAMTAKNRNVAIVLRKENLTTDGLVSAIRAIVHEDSYRKNAQKLAQMMREKPMSAKERLVRNVEFVIKHSPIDNFNLFGTRLNIFQYFLVDVLLLVVPSVLFVSYIFTAMVLHIFSLVFKILAGIERKKTNKH